MSLQKINSLLELADNALIIGHRLSEWCGHGPVLEQDIALTNTALDHLGQARNLYQYTAELINQLSKEERRNLFSSVALQNKDNDFTEDDLAYLRDAWDFKNALLVEQPNKDWAYTLARSFFYDHFNFLLYQAIVASSKDDNLKAVAQKSLKEVEYHTRWSSEWVIRLGDGTEESHERMQAAINDTWAFTGELFTSYTIVDVDLDMSQIKNNWETAISAIIEEATLQLPSPDAWMQSGGKKGIHSEHLGFILSELQFIQRAYPGMEW